MRIAQVAPLTEAIPPKLYGGTERVVHWLTEELVALGHDVTLFASGDSCTSAKLEAVLAARAAARRFGPRSERAAHGDAGAGAAPAPMSSICCTFISTIIRSRCSRASRRRSSRRCTAGSICPSTSRCSTRFRPCRWSRSPIRSGGRCRRRAGSGPSITACRRSCSTPQPVKPSLLRVSRPHRAGEARRSSRSGSPSIAACRSRSPPRSTGPIATTTKKRSGRCSSSRYVEYIGEIGDAREIGVPERRHRAAGADRLARAVRAGDDRGDGVRHAGDRLQPRLGAGDDRGRRDRLHRRGRGGRDRRGRSPRRICRARGSASGSRSASPRAAWRSTISRSIAA